MLILVLKREHKPYVCVSVVSWNVNELEVIITWFVLFRKINVRFLCLFDVEKWMFQNRRRQTIYFPLQKMQLLNV